MCHQFSRSMVQGGSHSQALPGESEDKLSKVTAGYTFHPVKMRSHVSRSVFGSSRISSQSTTESVDDEDMFSKRDIPLGFPG